MNIGNPTEFTIKQLAEMTIRLTESSSKIIYKPLPQVSRTRADVACLPSKLHCVTNSRGYAVAFGV